MNAGNYGVPPLDLLRMWQTRIEAWIPAEVGIEQPKVQEATTPPALVAVDGGNA